MAGIGVRLNRIYSKNTIITSLFGFGYSLAVTIAPMCLVMLAVALMQVLLGFSGLGYTARELYSCTVLYIFIFSLLTTSPFNAVLSKYMSDAIYNEAYADILPCYYVGLALNVGLAGITGIPFCVREYLVSDVSLLFVFTGYSGYVALVLVFYSMLYLAICKDYKKISLFFLIGMGAAILLSLGFVYLFRMETTLAMLLSLTIGFVIIAALELALVTCYFRDNSGKYREVLRYCGQHWQLMLTNFLYTLGLYAHNMVFWTTDMRMVAADSFVCAPAYDMASCLALFTNITASVIFISRVEMHFHERYKQYSEAVIGGRGSDIEGAKRRMFSQLSEELMNLVRIQFILSAVFFLLANVFLPALGFGGLVMQIYPCLAAGYFILFIMYAAIIFLYYFDDMTGAVLTSLSFLLTTLVGSALAARLPAIWYGIGLTAGAFAGWSMAYHRLRVMEKTLDVHIFCRGNLMKRGHGKKPSNKVYGKE